MEVSPYIKRHTDRAGDPLDGLVNMFDIGVVLAVAFLLAALQSVNLTSALTSKSQNAKLRQEQVRLQKGDTVRPVQASGQKGTFRGTPVGQVYRLPDGRLVYVQKQP